MSNELPARANPSRGSSYRLRRIGQKWPLLIWIGALVGVIYLYGLRGSYARVNGMVYANIEEISAPETGEILTVHVRDGDEVKKGQVLVTLDPELISLEIERKAQELVIDRLERKSRAHANLADLEDTLNNVIADRDRDEALKTNAAQKLRDLEAALTEGRALPADVKAADLELKAITAKVDTYPSRIGDLEKNKSAAAKLIDDLAAAEGSGNPEEEATALRVLKQRLADKTLVANADGRVQTVHKLHGVARIGEPIITFIPHRDDGSHPAKLVRGFVNQKMSPETLRVGDTVWISQRERSPVAYATKIISVAPAITAIENRGSPMPGQFQRGREFQCELPTDLAELLPGTEVHIHREEPGNFDIWSFGKTPVKATAN